MKLREWFDNHCPMTRKELANKLGISVAFLQAIILNRTQPGDRLAWKICEATGGMVTLAELEYIKPIPVKEKTANLTPEEIETIQTYLDEQREKLGIKRDMGRHKKQLELAGYECADETKEACCAKPVECAKPKNAGWHDYSKEKPSVGSHVVFQLKQFSVTTYPNTQLEELIEKNKDCMTVLWTPIPEVS